MACRCRVPHLYVALCGWIGCAGAERGFIVNRNTLYPTPPPNAAYGLARRTAPGDRRKEKKTFFSIRQNMGGHSIESNYKYMLLFINNLSARTLALALTHWVKQLTVDRLEKFSTSLSRDNYNWFSPSLCLPESRNQSLSTNSRWNAGLCSYTSKNAIST